MIFLSFGHAMLIFRATASELRCECHDFAKRKLRFRPHSSQTAYGEAE